MKTSSSTKWPSHQSNRRLSLAPFVRFWLSRTSLQRFSLSVLLSKPAITSVVQLYQNFVNQHAADLVVATRELIPTLVGSPLFAFVPFLVVGISK